MLRNVLTRKILLSTLICSSLLFPAVAFPQTLPEQQSSEQVWKNISSYFHPPKHWENKTDGYRSLLSFQNGEPVKTADDWKKRRQEILNDWHKMLGPWPKLNTTQKLKILETKSREDFTQHKIEFEWIPGQTTTGYLLIPAGNEPKPAVICVYYEPETGIGLGKENRDFAYQLVKRGFVTLSLGTTEATAASTYSLYYPSIENAQVQPLSMLACASANAWHALANQPEVDKNRIGIVGHSFGGKWAMGTWLVMDIRW